MGKGDRPRPGRSSGAVYSALSAAIVVIIAALTITATQTPPPAIAELSPQAVEQIKEAPPEQSSEVGSAEGGAGAGGETATTTTALGATAGPSAPDAVTTTTAPPIERARVRRCIGNPPRQTEDPQSPPCVPYWSGDNGGATYKGVTDTTITVALPHGGARVATALENYFNKRFEFYGRQLEIIPAPGGNTCSERKGAAVIVDEEMQAFGALNASFGNAGACFTSELARRGLMSVVTNADFSENPTSVDLAPYLWQYNAAHDRMFTTIAHMACKRLAGENAIYSTDPLLQTAKRKFGLILQHTIRDVDVDLSPLERELAKCGEEAYIYRYSPSNDDPGTASPHRASEAMLQMKTQDVTSIICLCLAFIEQHIPAAATNQAYYPEWIFSSYGGNDTTTVIHAFWPEPRQRQAIVGVGVQPPMRDLDREPGWWALREGDPTVNRRADSGYINEFNVQYRAMLLMASGIQMAGPNLTPETFQAALHRTPFPNALDYPDPADPIKSGEVGFLHRDHSMMNDAVEFWWSEIAQSPSGYQSTGATGAFCYLDRADRKKVGQWPTEKNPFGKGECYTGAR